MAIECIPVRARVELAGVTVETPFVLSFNVRKSRGQFSTFDVSLKVSHEDVAGRFTGGPVVIWGGVRGNLIKIFTGYCKTAKINPCYDDPKYVLISASGSDALSLLQGKRYTRRCRATKGTYCTIQSARQGLKSGKFTYQNEAGPHDTNTGQMEAQREVTKSTTNSDMGNIPVAQTSTSKQNQAVAFKITVENEPPPAIA
jgi:hypothetical protein